MAWDVKIILTLLKIIVEILERIFGHDDNPSVKLKDGE